MFGKILKYIKKYVSLKKLQIQKKRLGIFEILNGNEGKSKKNKTFEKKLKTLKI